MYMMQVRTYRVSRGFTLVELMVVLALISLIALMGAGAVSAYKRANVTLYLQQLYQLAEATHRIKPTLGTTTSWTVGGGMVIDAAFPHGEVVKLGGLANKYVPPLGSSAEVGWSSSLIAVKMGGLTKDECREVLLKVSMAEFYYVFIQSPPSNPTLLQSSFPISYSAADGYCNNISGTMEFTLFP